MWNLRGRVLLDTKSDKEVVVVYVEDIIVWLRDHKNEVCNGIADWLDVCAMDLLRQHEECDNI